MSPRVDLVLANDAIRQRAVRWIGIAPKDTRVTFKGPKRTLDQNSYFWLLLTDIAVQKRWHGDKLTAAEWRLLFLDALVRETKCVPSLDGQDVVDLGRSSSDLSVEEMSDLIEIILAWGSANGVCFGDYPKPTAARSPARATASEAAPVLQKVLSE